MKTLGKKDFTGWSSQATAVPEFTPQQADMLTALSSGVELAIEAKLKTWAEVEALTYTHALNELRWAGRVLNTALAHPPVI